MENTIKVGSRIKLKNDKFANLGDTATVERVLPFGYVVRLDKSPLKNFNLLEVMEHEIELV